MKQINKEHVAGTRITQDLWQRFEAASADDGKRPSEVLREYIERYVRAFERRAKVRK